MKVGCVEAFLISSILFAAACDNKPKTGTPKAAAATGSTETRASATNNPTAPPNNPTPNAKPGPSNGPRWDSVNLVHDFGSVWEGREQSHVFDFANVGSETLKILEVKPACSCSVSENYTREVAPGQHGILPFRLNTVGKRGPTHETMIVRTNDPIRPDMVLTMKGDVKAIIETEVIADGSLPPDNPAALANIRRAGGTFGTVKADLALNRVIKLHNASGQPLKLTFDHMEPTGTPFSAELKETVKDQEYELTVVGKPPFQAGETIGAVIIKTNIPEEPKLAISLIAYVPPRLEVIPDKVVVDPAYPVVLKRDITLTNHGETPFDITGIYVSDPSLILELLPTGSPTSRSRHLSLTLPGADYRPPRWGELIRIETTDSERPVIDIEILPNLHMKAVRRPPDVPLTLQPGIMVQRKLP